jgi:peptidoglycan/xylan/chitin deacetylase (PgdA/CDA1 family)
LECWRFRWTEERVLRRVLIRSGLEGLYFTGAHRLLRGFLGGVGGILTLHHVRPPRSDAFQPNRLLEIAPAFLEQVITGLRASGVDIITLDEMRRRLLARDFGRRFVVFTFDDGYRDNREWAYPILKRHAVPFTIYVPASFPDGTGDLWWLTLEDVIAAQERIEMPLGGALRQFDCATAEAKQETFEQIYWSLRALPDEGDLRAALRALAERYQVDTSGRCRDLCMTWKEIAELAADPLVTIGAHTVNHFMLRKAPEDVVRREMQESADRIERELGRRPAHFSYPVGDPTSAGPREFAIARDLGFETAVTTRPGVLFPEHGDHLTALPRLSLNGEFQRMRYVEVLTSGAATALWNGFKRVDAA